MSCQPRIDSTFNAQGLIVERKRDGRCPTGPVHGRRPCYTHSEHPLGPPLAIGKAQYAQSSLVLRIDGQVEDGWRMSHGRDWLRCHLQGAMRVDWTEKRREAQFDGRDGLKVTVMCAMNGQIDGRLQAGHAAGLHPSHCGRAGSQSGRGDRSGGRLGEMVPRLVSSVGVGQTGGVGGEGAGKRKHGGGAPPLAR
ncbi:hypothetical protein F4803DRAFT_62840 [Xylaria telfairii]|nr:hypothetical protein F4803DRAFT_62840 [Xylaria telfairii]